MNMPVTRNGYYLNEDYSFITQRLFLNWIVKALIVAKYSQSTYNNTPIR